MKTIIESKIDLLGEIELETCKIVKLKGKYYMLLSQPIKSCCKKLEQLLNEGKIKIIILTENAMLNIIVNELTKKHDVLMIPKYEILKYYRIKNSHAFVLKVYYIDMNCWVNDKTMTVVKLNDKYAVEFKYSSLENIIKMYESLTGEKILSDSNKSHVFNLLTKDYGDYIKSTLYPYSAGKLFNLTQRQSKLGMWLNKQVVNNSNKPQSLKIEKFSKNYSLDELVRSKYKKQIYASLINMTRSMKPLTNFPLSSEEEKLKRQVKEDKEALEKVFINNVYELINGDLKQFDRVIMSMNFNEVSILGLKIKSSQMSQIIPVMIGLKYRQGYVLLGWLLGYINSTYHIKNMELKKKLVMEQFHISTSEMSPLSKVIYDELYILSDGKLRVTIPEHLFPCIINGKIDKQCILETIISKNMQEYPVLEFKDDYVLYGLLTKIIKSGRLVNSKLMKIKVSLNRHKLYDL